MEDLGRLTFQHPLQITQCSINEVGVCTRQATGSILLHQLHNLQYGTFDDLYKLGCCKGAIGSYVSIFGPYLLPNRLPGIGSYTRSLNHLKKPCSSCVRICESFVCVLSFSWSEGSLDLLKPKKEKEKYRTCAWN